MNRTVKVAVIGHSQIPLNFASYEGVEVRIFRKPMAQLDDINDPPLNEALSWHHDISILFIGGNDIFTKAPKQITEQIIETVQKLKLVSQQVFVVAIETREYLPDSSYGHRNDEYKNKARSVNRRLTSLATRYNYRTINFTTTQFSLGRRDGVHFGHLARGMVITRFKLAIDHARTSLRRIL